MFGRLTRRMRGVACGEALEDRPRAVCRAIIDDQELEVAKRLTENALDRLGHVALGVVGGHEDRDPWWNLRKPIARRAVLGSHHVTPINHHRPPGEAPGATRADLEMSRRSQTVAPHLEYVIKANTRLAGFSSR